MEAIVSALKQRGIPVAGVDRLKVSEHIAVQDLLSLARFLLLPADDLSLAEVLKSPLVEKDDGTPFDDDDLLRLRGELFDFSAPLERIEEVREERPLWEQLQAAAEAGAPVRKAVERLRRWRARAGHLPPYELFAHEAVEPLEAFLDLAMQYERDALPSLPAFVEWMAAEAPEIAREQEGAAEGDGDGEVRVMTVHGAKGLEAPVVFLADTVATPDERHMDVLEAPWPGEEVEEKLPVWVMRKEDRCAAAQELVTRTKQEAEEEYNRLLYVAMTRAADRLYVCGALTKKSGEKDNEDKSKQGKKKKKNDAADESGRTIWRYPAKVPAFRAQHPLEEAVLPALPGWATRPAPYEPGPALWLTPSRLAAPGEDEAPQAETASYPDDDRILSPLTTARLADDPLRRCGRRWPRCWPMSASPRCSARRRRPRRRLPRVLWERMDGPSW